MTAALLILATVAGGTLLTLRLHPAWPWSVRLAAGSVLGSLLTGLAGVAGALWLGPRGALPLAWVAALAPLATLAHPGRRREAADALGRGWRAARTVEFWDRERRRDALLGALALVALLLVFERAVLVGPAGIGTGVMHNFGDLPFHLAVASAFVHDAPFPPEHPELAGARLTYPYLVDFVAALWTRAGLELATAFRAQHFVLATSVLVLLWHWGLAFTRSRAAARLVPLIVLLGGGLGFLDFFADLRATGPDILGRLTRDYTISPDGRLRWGNPVLTLLVPQRGLLLGLPVVLLAASLWVEALDLGARGATRGAPVARLLARAGLLVGLLPLAHGHSFACLLAAAGALALLFPGARAWAGFFAAALGLGLPQALLLARDSSLQAGAFIAPHLGWDRGDAPVLQFWLLNTGALLPLWLSALCWRGREPLLSATQRRFHVPFALLFVVPNLLRLSPWIWDNIKFLVVWFVAAAPLLALALVRLARGRAPAQAAAVALGVTLTLAGALDLWRVASRQIALPLFDPPALDFARGVARLTPPGARILHWPAHDAPTLLSGRASVLGYPGHIWSQGLDGGTRAEDIAVFYLRGDLEVLRRHRVDFVVFGPSERQAGAWRLPPALGRGGPALTSGPYELYDARALASAR